MMNLKKSNRTLLVLVLALVMLLGNMIAVFAEAPEAEVEESVNELEIPATEPETSETEDGETPVMLGEPAENTSGPVTETIWVKEGDLYKPETQPTQVSGGSAEGWTVEGGMDVTNSQWLYILAAESKNSDTPSSIIVNGDVNAADNNGGSSYAVAAQTQGHGAADITVNGNVTNAMSHPDRYYGTPTAIDAYSMGPSTATITVNGDATATNMDKTPSTGGDGDFAEGIDADAVNGGTTKITVTGKVTAASDIRAVAVDAYATYKTSSTDVTVGKGATGEVILDAQRGASTTVTINEGGIDGDIDMKASGAGTSTLTVEEGDLSGNIKMNAQEGSTATLSAENSELKANSIEAENNGGTLEITVEKADISSTEEEGDKEGITIVATGESETSLTLGEGSKVISDEYGIVLNADETAKADILVDGTVDGAESSLVLVGDTKLGEDVTLTVWEVKKDENGAVVQSATENGDGLYELTGENKEAEAQIQYIIRVNADQKDIIAAAGDVFDYKGYKVAHENDTVTLKLNIPDGYEVVEAYSDQAQSMKLEKDASGNYFLTVQRGGAVELSVKLDKIPEPEPDPEPTPEPKPEPKPEPEPEPESEPEPEDPETVAITYILGNDTQYDHIRTTAAVGEGVALHPAPERDGYTFLYWQCTDVDPNSSYYVQPDPENDFQFRPGAIYTASKDINFVAVWKKN